MRILSRSLPAVAACLGLLLATTTSAQAVGTPGWYGSQPFAVGWCGLWKHLASGSDLQEIKARTCLTSWGSGVVQPTIVFANSSSSRFTASGQIYLQYYDQVGALDGSPTYDCRSHSIAPHGWAFCVGYSANVVSAGARLTLGVSYPVVSGSPVYEQQVSGEFYS